MNTDVDIEIPWKLWAVISTVIAIGIFWGLGAVLICYHFISNWSWRRRRETVHFEVSDYATHVGAEEEKKRAA